VKFAQLRNLIIKHNLDEIINTGQKEVLKNWKEGVKTALEEFWVVKRSNLGSKNKF
jgi:hypothetical protein